MLHNVYMISYLENLVKLQESYVIFPINDK